MCAVNQPVYLVRHGQSDWNVRRLTQGQTPHPPLTALGRAQAAWAARLLGTEVAARGVAVAGS
jgi:probable phosphoglycerate mutase